MTSLSLCMIVKNEEKWLPQCLEAAKPFVDEIIIVDTGSADTSIDIAKSFGATVIELPWDHDFATAKNAALEKATKDWILVLDADEKMTADDFKKLKYTIETAKADAFKLELRNYVQQAGLGCVSCIPSELTMRAHAYRPIRMVRLFRNRKEYRFENRVHELIEHRIEAAEGVIADANIPVHHYGILFANVKHKTRYYAWLTFKQLADDPENVRALYLAGQFMQEQNKIGKALEYYGKVVQLEPAYKNVWFTIANVLLSQKRVEDAIKAYEQSIVHNASSPNAPQAINNLAVLYANAGRKQDAKKLMELAVKRFPQDEAIRKNAERVLA
ncbi:MAG TPA: glycosyltransferase [Candidatus Binatia bacterium]|nr:glycosyltransferase [Candidatus Binatia bacterium]